jgi:hypothetical protein
MKHLRYTSSGVQETRAEFLLTMSLCNRVHATPKKPFKDSPTFTLNYGRKNSCAFYIFLDSASLTRVMIC